MNRNFEKYKERAPFKIYKFAKKEAFSIETLFNKVFYELNL